MKPQGAPVAWLAKEDAILRATYARDGLEQCGELLKRHTAHAIRQHAHRLGLRHYAPAKPKESSCTA